MCLSDQMYTYMHTYMGQHTSLLGVTPVNYCHLNLISKTLCLLPGVLSELVSFRVPVCLLVKGLPDAPALKYFSVVENCIF